MEMEREQQPAWSTIPLMRTIIFEIPLLGMSLTVARFALSLPLPVNIGPIVLRLEAIISRGAGASHEDTDYAR